MDPERWTAGTRGLFAVVVGAWGLNYLVVSAGLTGSGPLWLATLRGGIGLGGAVALLTALRGWAPMDRAAKRDALMLGLPNTALFFGLWFVAAQQVSPGIASVVIYTFPLWVAMLSGPVLGRPLPAAGWAAVSAGFVGVALIAQVGGTNPGGVLLLPLLELAGAAASWALGTVLFQRRFTGPEVLPANAFQLAGGSVALLAASLTLTPGALPHPTAVVVASALWLGLVGTSVAYLIWFSLLDRRPAAELSAYLFLVPVVALGASALFLGERLTWLQGAGVVLVLVAIYGIGRTRWRGEEARVGPVPGAH